jgi:copper(I)-binding protein
VYHDIYLRNSNADQIAVVHINTAVVPAFELHECLRRSQSMQFGTVERAAVPTKQIRMFVTRLAHQCRW